MVDEIKLEHLVVVPGRAIDESIVAELAKSFTEVGILNPITVGRDRSVIAGVHRFEAAKRLGWKKIPAVLLEVDELRIRLARIDENLIRNEGTALERAEALRQRKEIYEALHPTAKHGGDRASRHNGDLKPDRFTEDAAKKAGISERTVQRHVQVAEKLDPKAKETLKAAQLDTGIVDLERLSSLPNEMQRAVATGLVNGGKVPRRPQAAMNVEPAEGDDKNERFTPRDLIEDLHQLYRFTVDAASDPRSPAAKVIGCHWTKKDNGLKQRWGGQRLWINPPFDELELWVARVHTEMDGKKPPEIVAMILPATRTEQPFWQDHIEPYRDGRGDHARSWTLETRFLRGRTVFGSLADPEGEKSGSPLFACVLVIWERKGASVVAPAGPTPGVCVGCGCTDDRACTPPCSWLNMDRTHCSACFEVDAGDEMVPKKLNKEPLVKGQWRRGKGTAHFHEDGNRTWGSVCGRPFEGTVAIDEPKRPQKCLTCVEYVERQELYRKQDAELAPSKILAPPHSSPAVDDGKRCGIRPSKKGDGCIHEQGHDPGDPRPLHSNGHLTWRMRKPKKERIPLAMQCSVKGCKTKTKSALCDQHAALARLKKPKSKGKR